ncbi:hypothetical protein J8273_4874 [Carpediemonas membranifera]|uniref:Uncharacterized protein n=1 Tax=Carpediemonas membranifera TaxID=201153 RepID=A0A8J6AVT0_9EUKA|nr:hypothetical protein J8273_4874 [Carpediemonas membranifera]|eukprot:KAG9393755.1 hypothetical protein J8273_4874 [Carpediemonas membranifera]
MAKLTKTDINLVGPDVVNTENTVMGITDTPLVKIGSQYYSGLLVSLRTLCSTSKNHPIAIKDNAIQANVDEWITFIVTSVCPKLFCEHDDSAVVEALEFMNEQLAPVSFLAKLASAADVLMYVLLQDYMRQHMAEVISAQPHVVRWFQCVQGFLLADVIAERQVEGLTEVQITGLPETAFPEL